MTKTVKIIPPILLLSLIGFFVEPVRSTLEQLFFLFSLYDVATIKGYILSFGIWSPVISFALMLFQSLIAPLPAFLITFANAAIFGWIYGALLSWTSAMAGAALCFFIARALGREATEKLTTRLALSDIDLFFQRHGKYTILIARLLPFVSFDIVSYAAGLTSMNFWSFFWATGLGQLPATIIYSFAGQMLTGTTQKIVAGLLILFAVSVLGLLLKRIMNPEMKNTLITQKGATLKLNRQIYAGITATAIAVAVFLAIHHKSSETATPQPAAFDLSQFANGEDIFITPDALYNKLGESNLIILDGNHPKVYAKGHIPGAISIGFKGLSRSIGKPGDPQWGTILPRAELRKKLESLGVTNNSLIVCYSDTFKGPGAGGRAVWQLRMAGLNQVKLLYGGMNLWKQAGYQLTEESPEVHPASGLQLQSYNENYRADQHFVLENLDKLRIIDVRSRNEFTGDDTSRGEARGGHITNAVWLEWKSLLRPDSTPRPAEEIIALMADIGVRTEDDFVVY